MSPLREVIEGFAPERTNDPRAALQLCDAVYALGGGLSMLFDEPLPPEPDRPALRDRAMELLRTWIPALDATTAQELGWRVEQRVLRGRVDLEVLAADLEQRRDQVRQDRLNATKQALHAERIPAELAQLVADDPDDRASYEVLADALIGAGDPRGELIALHLAAHGEGSTTEQRIRAEDHLEQHEERLLGPLANYLPAKDPVWRTRFDWRWGFIHGATLALDDPGDHTCKGRIADLLDLLLAHPAGRFLAELNIGIAGMAGSRNDLTDVIRVLAEHAPRTLRALHLGTFKLFEESNLSEFHIGDMSPLWPALPRLRKLIVQGGTFGLGNLALPELEHLEIRTGGLRSGNMRAIAEIAAPRLSHLEVWFGSLQYGGDTTVADVAPLLARSDLILRYLGLRNAEHTDQICTMLPASPLAPRSSCIDLSMGCMTDVGATELVRGRDRLPRIRIDVSDNYLTELGIAELRAAFRSRIDTGAQKVAVDGDRYVTVGE